MGVDETAIARLLSPAELEFFMNGDCTKATKMRVASPHVVRIYLTHPRGCISDLMYQPEDVVVAIDPTLVDVHNPVQVNIYETFQHPRRYTVDPL